MTFRLNLGEEDYLKAAKLHGRRWLWRFALPYFVIFSGVMFWIVSRSAGIGMPFLFGFMTFLVLVLLFKWFVQMPARTRKTFRQQVEAQSELTCTLEEDCFVLEHKNGFVRKPWDEFWKWVRSEDYLLIFPNDQAYFLIPKHQLNDDEWEKACAMVAEKVVVH